MTWFEILFITIFVVVLTSSAFNIYYGRCGWNHQREKQWREYKFESVFFLELYVVKEERTQTLQIFKPSLLIQKKISFYQEPAISNAWRETLKIWNLWLSKTNNNDGSAACLSTNWSSKLMVSLEGKTASPNIFYQRFTFPTVFQKFSWFSAIFQIFLSAFICFCHFSFFSKAFIKLYLTLDKRGIIWYNYGFCFSSKSCLGLQILSLPLSVF